MEFIADNMETILLVIGQITAAVVAIVSLIKALRSEVRAKAEVGALKSDVAITRAGIVQAFKEAVVTKDVPAYGIVGGVPARLIKKRFSDPVVEMLQKIKWWDWEYEKIKAHLDIIRQGDVTKLSKMFR